ncbi:M56 family metallopeptidase [Ruicaihuangia caeni]|uniref:M56 family metallopeptidase n=1 Tax=Ruicaihuangia caeni TaxID=3042517 RepID=UPI00338E4363
MAIACAAIALLAVLLAWPVPVVLARARWTTRSPAVALALWQAIALGGGLAMIGSLLGYGLLPTGLGLVEAVPVFAGALFAGPLPAAVGVTQGLALSAAVILGIHLLLNLARTAAVTERQRRRHRELVGLLSSPIPSQPGARMLDHPAPVAYCLPGVHTITVLSQGLIELLADDELEAVLAHERTHLRQQHHLVLLAFKAWNAALPWFPIANRAERSVAELVEMLADDEARRTVSGETLARAIKRVGSAWESPDASGTGYVPDAVAVQRRAERLEPGNRPLSPAARSAVLTGSAALALAPAIFMLGLL